MVCCSQQQVLYLLHESGSVSVWSKRSQLAVVAATPAISRSASFVTTPGDLNDSHGADLLLEVSYESKTQNEHVRLGKNCRVLGLALHPINR